MRTDYFLRNYAFNFCLSHYPVLWRILQSNFPRKQTRVLSGLAPSWWSSMRWDNIVFPQLTLNFSLGIICKQISKCIWKFFPGKEIKEINPINTLNNCLIALLDYISSLTSTSKQVHKPFKTINICEASSQKKKVTFWYQIYLENVINHTIS